METAAPPILSDIILMCCILNKIQPIFTDRLNKNNLSNYYEHETILYYSHELYKLQVTAVTLFVIKAGYEQIGLQVNLFVLYRGFEPRNINYRDMYALITYIGFYAYSTWMLFIRTCPGQRVTSRT